MAVDSRFFLLLDVRRQIFVNNLRHAGKKLELVGRILVGLLAGVGALAFGLFIGTSAFTALHRDRSELLGLALWAIFIVWQVLPLGMNVSTPSLNFREIARYPVSFALYSALDAVYGLVDPMALICLCWTACFWLGAVVARPALWGRLTLLAAAFALVNLLWSRVVTGFFERVLGTRKGRQRVLVFFMFVMFVVQIGSVLLFQSIDPARRSAEGKPAGNPWIRNIGLVFGGIYTAAPQGLTLRGIMAQDFDAVPLAAMAAEAAVAALLLRRQLWRKYRGSLESEVAAPRSAAQAEPAWEVPFLNAGTAAIFEKELRYFLREPASAMGFFVTPLTVVLFHSAFLQRSLLRSPDMIYPSLAGFVVLSTCARAYNSFCYDGRGFHFWLLAPIEMRQVIFGKNLALAAISLTHCLLVTVGSFYFRPIPVMRLITVLVGTTFALLLCLGIGNFFAVRYPAAMEYGTMRSEKTSPLAILAGVFFQLSMGGFVWAVFYFKLPLLPSFTLLALAAAPFYRFSLNSTARYVLRHREDMAARLM